MFVFMGGSTRNGGAQGVRCRPGHSGTDASSEYPVCALGGLEKRSFPSKLSSNHEREIMALKGQVSSIVQLAWVLCLFFFF